MDSKVKMFEIFEKCERKESECDITCRNEPNLSDGDETCLCGGLLHEIERRLKRIPLKITPGRKPSTIKNVDYVIRFSYTFNCTNPENKRVKKRIGRFFQMSPKMTETHFNELNLEGLSCGKIEKRFSDIEKSKQSVNSNIDWDEWDAADEALAYAFEDLASTQKKTI